jgi:hypothetical protein
LPNAPEGSESYVDLVGAVHIGDRSYYQELNRLFAGYETVLYELVAPPNVVPQPGQRTTHPISLLQRSMETVLNLDFQLDCIDYSKPNFVHADLSPEEFRKSMADRSESITRLLLRLWGQGMAQQSSDPGRASDVAVLWALFSKDRATELKRAMAVQFEDLEKATLALEGPKGSTIIDARNDRALSVLDTQLKAGKQRVAIFYGAAHLPDFDRKLRDLRYIATTTRWLVAWEMGTADARTVESRKPVQSADK